MSGFRVGQRVRFVYAKTSAQQGHVGKEATVLVAGCKKGEFTLGAQNMFDADYLIDLPSIHGGRVLADADQLEPILPEGAAPSTWAECAWQPEHMRVPA